jgi:hypothetical protein
MLDQREETRLVVSKSEHEKAEKKMAELCASLEADHARQVQVLHCDMDIKLVLRRAMLDRTL